MFSLTRIVFFDKNTDVKTSENINNQFKQKAEDFMQQHRGVTARLDHLVSKLL